MNNVEKMKEYAHENDVPIMQDGGIQFLCNLIKDRGSYRILECGTAIGYSSICMAKVNPKIIIDTCEIKHDLVCLAINNIKQENCDHQITVHECDAVQFSTDKKYDLIFVDAAKAQYRKYMEHFMDNLSDDGVFVFDNLNFHGMVDDPSLTSSRNTKALVRKIKEFRDYILDHHEFNTKFYPEIGDGVAVVEVKKVL